MRTLIGVLFCILLGAQVGTQGIGALFWFPVGFILSLFVSSQVVLPIIMGLPRAARRVIKGQMRAAVLGFILLAPASWAFLLVAVAWLWPALIEYLVGNASFSLGSLLGLIGILLTPLSGKGRADFSEDFDTSYGRFCESSAQLLRLVELPDGKRKELFAEAGIVLEPLFDDSTSADGRLLLESHHVFDSEVVILLRDLARQLITAGICEVGPLVDELYDLVSPFFDDSLTKDDVRDAFSGYTGLDESDPEVQRYRAEIQGLRNLADGLIKETEGTALEEQQSWEQAEIAYSEALRLNPNSKNAAEAIRRVKGKALRATKNAL